MRTTVHHFISSLITWWFSIIDQWGYLGIFVMMAIESSIIPLPSEVIIPPAAYYASIGRFDMTLVVLSGAAGSLFGSLIMYGASRLLGRPFLMRYGKYVFIKPDKVELGERFFLKYSTGGVFFARLILIVRHLISIPAGIARMNILLFSVLTTVGAGLWCAILAFFSNSIVGGRKEIATNPDLLIAAFREKSLLLAGGAVVMFVLYVFVMRFAKSSAAPATGTSPTE
jgi:membrane protein DedA with SNARE-associated domain